MPIAASRNANAANDAAYRRNQRARRRRGANHELSGIEERSRLLGDLLVREVDLRLARALQAADTDIAHHADDGALVGEEGEPLPDGILVGPVALDERLAHHGH